MAGDDDKDLLALFSSVPDEAPAASRPAPVEPKSPPGIASRPATPTAPPPSRPSDEDDLSLLSDISDMFGERLDTKQVETFSGPTAEQLRAADTQRAKIREESAAAAAAPPVPKAADEDARLLARLEEELKADVEREIQAKVEKEVASAVIADADAKALAERARKEALEQVRVQMAEWEELRKQREAEERAHERDRLAQEAEQRAAEERAKAELAAKAEDAARRAAEMHAAAERSRIAEADRARREAAVPPPPSLPPPPEFAAAPPLPAMPAMPAMPEMPAAPAFPSAPPLLSAPSFAVPPAAPALHADLPLPQMPAPSMPGGALLVGSARITHEANPTAVVVAAPAEKPARRLGNMSLLELLLMFDEARKILAGVVTQLIGPKATHTMLTKTFEKSRTRFPRVYRNANWKADGNLREDGSLDKERVLRNLQEIPESKRTDELLAALADLLALRLSAVEQGLAKKVAAAVICDITDAIQRLANAGRYEKGNVAVFIEEILPPVSLD